MRPPWVPAGPKNLTFWTLEVFVAQRQPPHNITPHTPGSNVNSNTNCFFLILYWTSNGTKNVRAAPHIPHPACKTLIAVYCKLFYNILSAPYRHPCKAAISSKEAVLIDIPVHNYRSNCIWCKKTFYKINYYWINDCKFYNNDITTLSMFSVLFLFLCMCVHILATDTSLRS